MRFRLVSLIAFFLADRLLKNYIWFSAPKISEVFFITPILNKNIAFSIPFPENSTFILLAMLAVIMIFLIWQSWRLFSQGDRMFFWWGMICIGALSNFMDRINLGGVLDFVNLKFWPVFNVSDVYIVLGVLMIIIYDMFFRKRQDA
jgi:signal peptidase II